MGNELKAGSRTSESLYSGSMAKTMEQAFVKEWKAVMGGDAPKVSEELKLMFVAMAQGVVKHLRDNKDAFIMDEINNGGGITKERLHDIETRDTEL